MNDRCEYTCLHGGRCRLVAGHRTEWCVTRSCPEFGAACEFRGAAVREHLAKSREVRSGGCQR